jgi:hypothetical protein
MLMTFANQIEPRRVTMAVKFTGGCLCGAVRYATEAQPLFAGNCHCKDCQRATGGPYTPALFFPAAALTITGNTQSYRSIADSGNYFDRLFCPVCGSSMFGKLQMMPEAIGLRAGTLDDPSLYTPQMDIYVRSAAHWDVLNPALPKFEGPPVR